MNSKRLYVKHVKRAQDFILSLIAIVLLSPVLLVVAIMVKVKLGGPVLFCQDRPGLNERIFTMYKFRTMTNEYDEKGDLLPDHIRLSKFGMFLRSTSLDELPELFNILKGDMSIIGPRPLLIEYLPLYNDTQRIRHTVRPGLSGLAQVNGRNAITWDEKLELDVEYVKTMSLKSDWQLILRTIVKVIKREDVSSNEYITMERFKGSTNE